MAKEDTRAKPVEAQFYKPRGGFLSREQPPSLPLDDQFIWIANFKAKPGKRDELMDVVLTHTKNVERDEKDTSSFLVLEKTDDDVSICLFERYTSEEYFKTTHVTSNSMQEFRSKVLSFGRAKSIYFTMLIVPYSSQRSSTNESVEAFKRKPVSSIRGRNCFIQLLVKDWARSSNMIGH